MADEPIVLLNINTSNATTVSTTIKVEDSSSSSSVAPTLPAVSHTTTASSNTGAIAHVSQQSELELSLQRVEAMTQDIEAHVTRAASGKLASPTTTADTGPELDLALTYTPHCSDFPCGAFEPHQIWLELSDTFVTQNETILKNTNNGLASYGLRYCNTLRYTRNSVCCEYWLQRIPVPAHAVTYSNYTVPDYFTKPGMPTTMSLREQQETEDNTAVAMSVSSFFEYSVLHQARRSFCKLNSMNQERMRKHGMPITVWELRQHYNGMLNLHNLELIGRNDRIPNEFTVERIEPRLKPIIRARLVGNSKPVTSITHLTVKSSTATAPSLPAAVASPAAGQLSPTIRTPSSSSSSTPSPSSSSSASSRSATPSPPPAKPATASHANPSPSPPTSKSASEPAAATHAAAPTAKAAAHPASTPAPKKTPKIAKKSPTPTRRPVLQAFKCAPVAARQKHAQAIKDSQPPLHHPIITLTEQCFILGVHHTSPKKHTTWLKRTPTVVAALKTDSRLLSEQLKAINKCVVIQTANRATDSLEVSYWIDALDASQPAIASAATNTSIPPFFTTGQRELSYAVQVQHENLQRLANIAGSYLEYEMFREMVFASVAVDWGHNPYLVSIGITQELMTSDAKKQMQETFGDRLAAVGLTLKPVQSAPGHNICIRKLDSKPTFTPLKRKTTEPAQTPNTAKQHSPRSAVTISPPSAPSKRSSDLDTDDQASTPASHKVPNGKRWFKDDSIQLLRMYVAGDSWQQMADKFQRTVEAVRQHLVGLGISWGNNRSNGRAERKLASLLVSKRSTHDDASTQSDDADSSTEVDRVTSQRSSPATSTVKRNGRRSWPTSDDVQLLRLYIAGTSWEQMEQQLQRTAEAAKKRCRNLGLSMDCVVSNRSIAAAKQKLASLTTDHTAHPSEADQTDGETESGVELEPKPTQPVSPNQTQVNGSGGSKAAKQSVIVQNPTSASAKSVTEATTPDVAKVEANTIPMLPPRSQFIEYTPEQVNAWLKLALRDDADAVVRIISTKGLNGYEIMHLYANEQRFQKMIPDEWLNLRLNIRLKQIDQNRALS